MNNKQKIWLSTVVVLSCLCSWPAFAIELLPSTISLHDVCVGNPPPLSFREMGFSLGSNVEGTIDPRYAGTLYYIDIPVEDASNPHHTEIFDALITSGWALVNSCTKPREYWTQYSIEQTAYFPALFAKHIAKASGPKTNGAQCTTSGNPINIANGNNYQAEVDVASSAPSGLNFIRYYNSNTGFYAGDMGRGWTHTYSPHLQPFNDNAAMGVNRANGKLLYYKYEGGQWVSDPDITQKMTNILDDDGNHIGWRYLENDNSIEEYDLEGNLKRIVYTNGNTQQLSYDALGRLSEVLDRNGSYIRFQYGASDRINAITDHGNNSWTYQYDGLGKLVAVGNPDGTSKQYHYEDVANVSALTGITDENGVRYATWAYDDMGRAISSEHAGSVDKTTLDYTYLEDAADPRVTVTNPLGKQTTYHLTTLHGVRKVTQVEGHPTASCAGANQAYQYDANGNVISKTDWNGVVTTYTYDPDRNLELSRAEAAGTPEARTITTEWHPYYRLPLRVAEPNKVIEYSYDTQGQLLRRREQSVQ